MVPNVNFQATDISSDASGFDNKLRTYDFAFYYSPLELDTLTLNTGLNFRRYDGELKSENKNYTGNSRKRCGNLWCSKTGALNSDCCRQNKKYNTLLKRGL
jgi:hypothetical protein